jgi:hypothetical protein
MTRQSVADSDRRPLLASLLWVANHLVECVGVGTALVVASFLVSRTQMPYWIGVVLGVGGFALMSTEVAAYALTDVRRRWFLLSAAGVAVGGVLFVLPGVVRPEGSLYGVAAFLALASVFAWWRAGHRWQP